MIIQKVFGWSDSYGYQFSPEEYGLNPTIGLPSEDVGDIPDLDARKTRLKDIFKEEKQKFIYIYDFGDEWIHEITLEKILPERIQFASCIEGMGNCPPEGCGGPWGYERIKEILRNPEHEDFEEIREWFGLSEDDNDEVWDENYFDLEEVNERLNEL
jgi:hypothetical protein